MEIRLLTDRILKNKGVLSQGRFSHQNLNFYAAAQLPVNPFFINLPVFVYYLSVSLHQKISLTLAEIHK
jgi:hypothetical protein